MTISRNTQVILIVKLFRISKFLMHLILQYAPVQKNAMQSCWWHASFIYRSHLLKIKRDVHSFRACIEYLHCLGSFQTPNRLGKNDGFLWFGVVETWKGGGGNKVGESANLSWWGLSLYSTSRRKSRQRRGSRTSWPLSFTSPRLGTTSPILHYKNFKLSFLKALNGKC
jgi:hypothetical protein